MLEETLADTTHSLSAPVAANRDAANALDDTRSVMLKRDSIQLLLQSPHRLYLYWSFAADPHATLREAFGELAAHYRLAVRLVKVESGEEFFMDAARERLQWFEVYPSHVYRADVGFHAANRPFVRLLSSNVVRTPPDSASQLSDTDKSFQLEPEEFLQLLRGAGYERYARGLTGAAAGGSNASRERGQAIITDGQQSADAIRDATDEYPHR